MYTKGQKNRLIRRGILFLASQSITLFGSTLVQMAVVWYVTLSTSSGVWTAAFSICLRRTGALPKAGPRLHIPFFSLFLVFSLIGPGHPYIDVPP